MHTVLSKLQSFFFKRSSARGFTLIETIFAILIFTASLVALISVSARGLGSSSTSREEIVARYLAMEGLEVVRNVRDTNYVRQNTPWLSGISDVCTPECHAVVSSAGVSLESGGYASYYLDQTTGSYSTEQAGDLTQYRGTITIEEIDDTSSVATGEISEVLVTSEITWMTRGNRTRTIEYSNYLKKWR